jgi:phage-related protein
MEDDEDIIEIPLRPLVWMGDSLKNIRSFPLEVRASVGYALQLVQAGETPMDAKPFKGVGSGVYEIVKRYDTDTYRAVYAVKIKESFNGSARANSSFSSSDSIRKSPYIFALVTRRANLLKL